MRKFSYLLILASLCTLSGCAARRSGVVIDPAGVDMGRYQQDLAECRQLAKQVHGKAARGAVGGAVVGGAVGAVVGGHDSVEKGAGVGAVTGLARGAAATRRERLRVIKNCLRYRGYKVLN
jgi:outer membrane lipoprotein SlyB